MKTNPITAAAIAKGPSAVFKRAWGITRFYGLTSYQMDQALCRYADVLSRYDCGASFPITAVTLKRNRKTISKYLNQNIEFVMHGYTHIDYSKVLPDKQLSHLNRACGVFTQMGISYTGFRSPYLRRPPNLNPVLVKAGFSYVSNQTILWDALGNKTDPWLNCAGYQRALAFYEPWKASERPSLPWLDHQLVEIPVSLPDDEILIERLGGTRSLIEDIWLRILSQTYQQGELFTLLLHPERIARCSEALSAVLAKARSFTPAVWCARMDEIASWWRARTKATIEITDINEGRYHCIVTGPAGTTVLTRAVEVDGPTHPWVDGYCQVEELSFTVNSPTRPFIGISPSTSPKFIDWLRQQGYIIEISEEMRRYQCYFDQTEFVAEQERLLLAQIEKTDIPLVRLGRWPNGARSALCITGDIDALTLWDYGLRLFGQ